MWSEKIIQFTNSLFARGVVLINPVTGDPYVASGGGSGGGAAGGAGTPVVDNAGVRWLWIYDKDAGTSTYVSFATGTTGTPTFPLTPDADTSVQVSNFPANPATSTLQTTANNSLASIDADIGLTTDAAATSDTGTFSLIALVKRGLTNWTTLLGRIPALVSGRMPVDGSGVTQPVSGPLTDTQLRASAVPVSGPLTDAQLRATAVPVSATALPLPAGAATSALQTTGNASLSSIDTKLPAQAGGRVPVQTDERPSASAAAITPSDTTALSGTTRGIYVGVSGTVVALIGGTAVTFVGVPAGTILPVQATRVNATGTNAASLVALF